MTACALSLLAGLALSSPPEFHAAPAPDGMILIPAGEFLMGAPAESGALADERPQRKVYLSAFWIDTFEVTHGAYRDFVEATGHRPPAHRTPNVTLWRGTVPPPEIQAHPVINVSWHDAQAYCRWAGKRLPTEAEWEKAARGTEGRTYPWGDHWRRDLANSASYWAKKRVEFAGREDWRAFWMEGEGQRIARARGLKGEVLTLPVGSFPDGVSPYGVHDMAGNVSEWTADFYNPYYYLLGPLIDPPGPDPTILKSIRGGSWLKPASGLRVTYRDYGEPDARMSGVGFRCARDDR